MNKLSNMMLLKLAFRTFFLQASWNYRGMMSLGFLYAVRPALDLIYPPGTARDNAYLRHLEYFNTNPYFSSIIIGVLVQLEERLKNKEISEDILHDTKEGLMTACAAIGDGLFWDSWRPFVAALTLVFAFNNYLLTPIIFLFIYNLPSLYFRFVGIFWGYNHGTDVIRKLRQFNFPQIRNNLRIGTMVFIAYLIPNHVNLHTPFLLSRTSLMYFYLGEKIVQGVGALILVLLCSAAYKAKIDVLMISFLLMIGALVLYHWGILI